MVWQKCATIRHRLFLLVCTSNCRSKGCAHRNCGAHSTTQLHSLENWHPPPSHWGCLQGLPSSHWWKLRQQSIITMFAKFMASTTQTNLGETSFKCDLQSARWHASCWRMDSVHLAVNNHPFLLSRIANRNLRQCLFGAFGLLILHFLARNQRPTSSDTLHPPPSQNHHVQQLYVVIGHLLHWFRLMCGHALRLRSFVPI